MKSLSIRAKLIAFFSLLLLLVAGLSWSSLSTISGLSSIGREVADANLPAVRYAGALRSNMIDVRVSVLYHQLFSQPEEYEHEEFWLNKKLGFVDETAAQLKPFIDAPDLKAEFDNFQSSWSDFRTKVKEVIEDSREGKKAEAFQLDRNVMTPAIDKANDAVSKLVELINEKADSNRAHSNAVAQNGERLVYAAAGTTFALALLLMFLITYSIRKGIHRIVKPMRELASGDTSVEVPLRGEKTEMGEIADAVQVFKVGMLEREALQNEMAERETKAAEEKQRAMNQLAEEFERQVGQLVASLSQAASGLENSASAMAQNADQTRDESINLASAAEQTSSNVQTVAGATEELSSSAVEIGERIEETARKVSTVVKQIEDTDADVQSLAVAAQRIGDVVELIASIAEQTNLLALNATIEAARAGEAGKGFAVVAAEVKQLADQTSKATSDISDQIGDLRRVTDNVVGRTSSIGQSINEMNEMTTTVAASVEEQKAATSEIARSVNEAANGTTIVTERLVNVRSNAEETGHGANNVLAAAKDLASGSDALRKSVDEFLNDILTA